MTAALICPDCFLMTGGGRRAADPDGAAAPAGLLAVPAGDVWQVACCATCRACRRLVGGALTSKMTEKKGRPSEPEASAKDALYRGG